MTDGWGVREMKPRGMLLSGVAEMGTEGSEARV